jgi:hypothetical protein
MRKSLLRRPTPAGVVAFVALLLALGGTAYAGSTLAKNSVGTKQLKKGAVTNVKLANGAVGTAKIKNGSVTKSKINTSGLTVPNATTAGTASSATHATSAATLDNLTNLNWRVADNTAAQTIYTSPGGKLTVTAACSSTAAITLTLTTSVNNAVLDSYGTQTDQNVADFTTGTPVTFTNTAEERTIVYTEPGGQTVTLIYAVNNGSSISGANCLLDGTAFAN